MVPNSISLKSSWSIVIERLANFVSASRILVVYFASFDSKQMNENVLLKVEGKCIEQWLLYDLIYARRLVVAVLKQLFVEMIVASIGTTSHRWRKLSYLPNVVLQIMGNPSWFFTDNYPILVVLGISNAQQKTTHPFKAFINRFFVFFFGFRDGSKSQRWWCVD